MHRYNVKDIDWVNFFFLFLSPLAAAFLIYFWIKLDGFDYGQILMGILFYFITGISITAGYHRLFSHKAYTAHPLVKLIFLIFGAATFQNSVLKWGSDHRLHHTKVDTEDDPYSIQEGFFYAHMGWVFLKKNGDIKEKYAKDFLSDKLVLWQHKYYLLISVLAGLVLPALLGQLFFNSWLGGLAVAGMARVVLVHHCTFFINSLCHYLGTTPYTDTNSAKDSWIMALFTFGEGYHNFHHFFQNDYRNGIRWFHFDPTKWLINVLQFLGLAFNLKSTSHDKILAAKMHMRVKTLKDKTLFDDKFYQEVELLKNKVIESLRQFQDLKNQYRESKLIEIKNKMLEARSEFEKRLDTWNEYLSSLGAIPVSA